MTLLRDFFKEHGLTKAEKLAVLGLLYSSRIEDLKDFVRHAEDKLHNERKKIEHAILNDEF